MTRKQVAQRLGKSLATVRRLEGVLLHPTLDARGKARFDEAEVEELAATMERGEVTLWHHMRGANEPLEEKVMADSKSCEDCGERERELAVVRAELVEQGRRLQRELDEVRVERDKERERHRLEQREFERELRRFIADVVNA